MIDRAFDLVAYRQTDLECSDISQATNYLVKPPLHATPQRMPQRTENYYLFFCLDLTLNQKAVKDYGPVNRTSICFTNIK